MNETSPGAGAASQPTQPLPPTYPWDQPTRPMPRQTDTAPHDMAQGPPAEPMRERSTTTHDTLGDEIFGAPDAAPAAGSHTASQDSAATQGETPTHSQEPSNEQPGEQPTHPRQPFSVKTMFFGTLDLVLDFIVGGLFLTVLIVLFSAGISMVPMLGVGLLVLAGAVYVAMAGVRVERRRSGATFGLDLQDPRPRRSERTGWLRIPHQVWLDASDVPLWQGLLHIVLTWCLGVITVLSLAAIGAGVAGAAAPLYAPQDSIMYLVRAEYSVPSWAWPVIMLSAVLVGLALITLSVIAHRRLSAGLLRMSRSAELRREAAEQARRAEKATQERESAVRGAHTERSRIERDLHDGVQPQLVSVAMNLSMARSKIDTDPAGAKELVAEAHGTTKAAITELRRLARGFHPAVLEDRGLDAALTAVAAQAHFPVDVHVNIPRLPAETEAAVYFAVSESITNAIKHSGARSADVGVSLQDGPTPGSAMVVAGIRDWGRGGAHVVPGGGLSGIEDRIRGAGGRFFLHSPVGGPTEVIVELPVTPATGTVTGTERGGVVMEGVKA